jgi:integrase
LGERKAPADDALTNVVFITKYGGAWSAANYGSAITHETTKILEEIGIKRPGLSFYALRHTFRTVADGSLDQPAIDRIMGHSREEDMATHYREEIDEARIAAVVAHVRAWLFGK